MRIALLGDIHANIEALDAVLDALGGQPFDAVYHTGDIVGYCVDFDKVIQRVRENGIEGVIGNHELMVLGRIDSRKCVARDSIDLTVRRMQEDDRDFIQSLPSTLRFGDTVMFHAQPDSYVNYTSNEKIAGAVFDSLDREEPAWHVAIHGHTHKQRVFERTEEGVALVLEGEGEVTIDPHRQYIVSPGSVGIARDMDPRTAYMTYEDGVIRQFRIEYDWESCQNKIREAGLKTRLFRTTRATGKPRSRVAGFLRSLVRKAQ